jgi:hypothetical protein
VVRCTTRVALDAREIDDRLVELDHHRIDQRQNPTIVVARIFAGRIAASRADMAPLKVISYF